MNSKNLKLNKTIHKFKVISVYNEESYKMFGRHKRRPVLSADYKQCSRIKKTKLFIFLPKSMFKIDEIIIT